VLKVVRPVVVHEESITRSLLSVNKPHFHHTPRQYSWWWRRDLSEFTARMYVRQKFVLRREEKSDERFETLNGWIIAE
jgi:hypothetical protein